MSSGRYWPIRLGDTVVEGGPLPAREWSEEEPPPGRPPAASKRRITPADVERMKVMRDEGLTQKAIADALGCSQWTVCNYLNPDREPTR